MNFFKEKSQGFILGLLVGLLIAGGFFILKLDDYFKELNFYKKVSETFATESKQPVPGEKQEDAPKEKTKKTEKIILKAEGEESDSLHLIDQKISADTSSMISANDSASKSPLLVSDEIVVKKDELLFTKTLEIFNLSPVASRTNGKDSLLQKVSGVKDDKGTAKQFLNIEFWQSPLNYKGFKLSKYKLVIYGMSTSDGIKLIRLDDTIYLKSSSFVYKLDYSSDFRAYERLTDETLLNKLK